MNLLTGNAYDVDTRGTGWFLGFSEWARHPGSDLLYLPQDQPVQGLCMKWFDHPDGHDSGPGKPVSEGCTVSVLVSDGSVFRIEFCEAADFVSAEVRTVRLQKRGDFAAWGEGLCHRWHCERRSTILTLRWTPVGEAMKGRRASGPAS